MQQNVQGAAKIAYKTQDGMRFHMFSSRALILAAKKDLKRELLLHYLEVLLEFWYRVKHQV